MEIKPTSNVHFYLGEETLFEYEDACKLENTTVKKKTVDLILLYLISKRAKLNELKIERKERRNAMFEPVHSIEEANRVLRRNKPRTKGEEAILRARREYKKHWRAKRKAVQQDNLMRAK